MNLIQIARRAEGCVPAGSQYLLRFDDLCPGMDVGRWERFFPLLERFSIKPILAIVPDNRDPGLESNLGSSRADVDPEHRERQALAFWDQMRGLEADGATIGLHGFRHVCAAKGEGLVAIHKESEFVGVHPAVQREWIREGLGILRGRGLDPQVWVAPRHGFDRATLDALWEEGIDIVSDGIADRPYRWCGMTWIPQQIWRPVVKASGLWTICLHAATASDDSIVELKGFLEQFGEQFTSVDRVMVEWPVHERSARDRLMQFAAVGRIRLTRALRQV